MQVLEDFHLVKRNTNACAGQMFKNLDVSRKDAVLSLCFELDIPQKLFESLQQGLNKTFWYFQSVKGVALHDRNQTLECAPPLFRWIDINH